MKLKHFLLQITKLDSRLLKKVLLHLLDFFCRDKIIKKWLVPFLKGAQLNISEHHTESNVVQHLSAVCPGSETCPSSILTPRPGWRWSGSPCACRWPGQWPARPPERGHIALQACASWCPSSTEQWGVKLEKHGSFLLKLQKSGVNYEPSHWVNRVNIDWWIFMFGWNAPLRHCVCFQ